MISIIMSCYKSNFEYLKEQIDSIINQTEKEWELLIYDDGTPGLEDFVKKYKDDRIAVFDNGTHLGYAKAYDYLMHFTDGEYICFCDHDDIWEQDKLEVEKKYLDEHPEVDCVFGWLHWFGEKNKIESFEMTDEEISKELPFWQPIKQPTAMFRKYRFGWFDSPYDQGADYWFWSKHSDRHYHLIPMVLVYYRRHKDELTKDKTTFRENTAKIIQRNMKEKGWRLTLETCKALDKYSRTYDPELKHIVQNYKEEKMRIVFCIDKNYQQMAKVSIESYKKNNPRAEIIVVSEEPMPESIGYHRNVIIKLDKQFRNRGHGDRITNTAYLKLFLTELEYPVILYVDADTICQKPLDELFRMPCQYINLCESHKYGEKQAKAIGNKRYGLTGMMMMNLDNLRKINFTEKCLEVEKNYPTPETGWQHDETCINVAMGDKLTFVDKKFNYCHNREYQNPIPESEAYILHYVGKDKKDIFEEKTYYEIWPLKEKIKGKNVAIVGNAQSIFDTQYGKEIDNADVVIRFNKGFITKPESQGTKTNILILGTDWITPAEIRSFNADYVINRSANYKNRADFTIGNEERNKMKNFIGSQPSTGFMAIDICLYFEAKSINLYGFDFEKTKTFYNPEDYKTQHNFNKEESIIREYEKMNLLKINS